MDNDKKAYGNLVSDNNKNDNWNTNMGISLPNSIDATHNIGLSPLFANLIGRAAMSGDEESQIRWRGETGYLWSATSARISNYARFVTLDDETIAPSNHHPYTSGFSLRCLVSTNNG